MKKIGKYSILAMLGKGGMGIVYKALDPDIEREVAIKTIRFDTLTEGTEKDEMMTRFIREAKAAGRLSHPNITTIYDVCREKDVTYIVMQFVEGQSLQALIDSGEKFAPQEIIQLMKPLCDCLDYAHQSGIVHRDIKPGNILIDKSGKPYLADFGVARIETSTLTQSGTTVGTLSYMSPEQVKGQTVDSRSDIFALGVILYELLAGKKPFAGENMSTIVYKIVHEEPERITAVNKDLPRGYEMVIQKALAKNPEDRYQNCQEIIADLENAVHLTGETLAYEGGQRTAQAAGGRKKSWLALAAGVLGFIAVAGGMYLVFSPRPEKPSPLLAGLGEGQKEKISLVTRSAGPAASQAGIPDETQAELARSFENKSFEKTIKLAEEILARNPADLAAQDYLNKAKSELVAAQVAPLLQSGISSYKSGNFSQCIEAMEAVLKLDNNHSEAAKYLFLADTALARKDILRMIELFRVAEENEDLLAVLGHIDSPSVASQIRTEYTLLFNGYDGIKSVVSNAIMEFPGRREARVSFSHLLTAVYKKDGQRKIVFEGSKTWQLKKKERTWKITGIQ
ncbi:MAG: serine/threonine protein kinase [Candidatus Aminicenantes bacterium]|nr:serine/threonine protein kinase [Candidatus Aminicenantes bacterium]